MTTPLTTWLDASDGLRRELVEKHYEALIAEATESRTGKVKAENVITQAVKEKARMVARGLALRDLNNIPEVNGVLNPVFHDSVWGNAANAEETAPVVTLPKADLADLAAWLRKQTWSDFAQSLAEQYARTGRLSPKQVESAQSMRAKVEARQAEKAAEAPAPAAAPVSPRDESLVLEQGIYTVRFPSGDYRTFKVRRVMKGNLEGKTIISFLSGQNNETDYTGFGFVLADRVAVWRRFQGGEMETRWLPALLGNGSADILFEARCVVCGRTLTTPESIEARIGPDCASGF